jgi:hypothetical protein
VAISVIAWVMRASSSMSWLGLPDRAMWPVRSAVSMVTVKLSG